MTQKAYADLKRILMKKAKPFRQVLISTEKNVRVKNTEIKSKNVTPKSAPWTIRKRTLHGGKQEGVDIIEVDNGALQMTIVPTRGMSILSVQCGDVRLGWDSPIKEIVHPAFIDLPSRGGLGWLEGFNEFLVRCGLESCGAPGTDTFVSESGAQTSLELTLHGKIGNIPASEIEVSVDNTPPYSLRIRGMVSERVFFGPQLELQSEIVIAPGEKSFRISDSVTNRGAQSQEFQLLYHTNFGQPLLEEGARFSAPLERVTPISAHAAKDVKNFAQYAAPTLGFAEQVYCMRLKSDAENRTLAMLRNKNADRAVSMQFSMQELPYFTLWKNANALGEGYVTGLEPGTGFPHSRNIEREMGRVPKLAAAQTRHFTIDFEIHVGKKEVEKIAGRIAEWQGETMPVLDEKPETHK